MLLDSSRSSLFAKTLTQWLFFVLTYFVLLQCIKNIFDKITNCLNQCGLIGPIKQSSLPAIVQPVFTCSKLTTETL